MTPAPETFEIELIGDVEVVRLSESKMPQAALEHLQNELSRRIDAGARKMIVNLAPVAFVDSFGIGVIAATARKMTQAGGQLKLCGIGERVRMSLTITRLDRTLDIRPDEADALRSFGADA